MHHDTTSRRLIASKRSPQYIDASAHVDAYPMSKPALPDRPVKLSRAFLRARREAWAILGLWGVCLLWCVGYSSLYGYSLDAAQAPTRFGMPHWVFGGVFVPWLLATLASVLFSLFVMQDDEEAAAGDSPGEQDQRPGEGTQDD